LLLLAASASAHRNETEQPMHGGSRERTETDAPVAARRPGRLTRLVSLVAVGAAVALATLVAWQPARASAAEAVVDFEDLAPGTEVVNHFLHKAG